MVFSSPIFLLWFLPLVLFFYYIINDKYKNPVLLLFSLLFYTWGEGHGIVLLLGSILLNYLLGLWINSSNNKKLVVLLAVLSNIGLLIYFKYGNFLLENYNVFKLLVGKSAISWSEITLPLGISFFTFQGLSYIIDIYRNETEAQRDIGKFALYISFFPQLIAGPIVRYVDVARDINQRTIDIDLFFSGAKRFIIGLAKKVLIANMLGRVPDYMYHTSTDEYNVYINLITVFCGGLQMYYDFSGYSDMAIGMGKMFGFHFLENFNYPYIAKSMTDFWKRWHISLSTWFRDYVYIPLGGNQKGKFRMYLNLWIVFILNGLWHGDNWNFLIFGILHGLALFFERLGFGKLLGKVPRLITVIYVFVFFSFTLVLFNFETIPDLFLFLNGFLNIEWNPFSRVLLYFTNEWFFILIIAIIFCFPIKLPQKLVANRIVNYTYLSALIIIFILSIAQLTSSSFNPFLYFRF